MRPSAPSRLEASMYTEYIRNYINESLSEFYKKCSRDIELACSSIRPRQLLIKNPDQMVESLLIQPFKVFICELAGEIDEKVEEYFGLEQNEAAAQLSDCYLYDYRMNRKLIAERSLTEIMSGLMVKLIDKTADFALLDQIQAPVNKKIIDSLSIGSIFMSSLGLDSHILHIRNIHELCKTLKGIGKNFTMRTRKHMVNQYTALIYQITEEVSGFSSYEQTFNEQVI